MPGILDCPPDIGVTKEILVLFKKLLIQPLSQDKDLSPQFTGVLFLEFGLHQVFYDRIRDGLVPDLIHTTDLSWKLIILLFGGLSKPINI